MITLKSGKEVDLLTSKSEHELENEIEKEKREKIKEKRKWNSGKNEDLESTVNEEPEMTINQGPPHYSPPRINSISSEYILSFHLSSPMHSQYYSPNHGY